ncbi:YbfB/YjiJ family MFS transporter [Nocardia sp. alder85J]|uniref:YbfB/YjiJ family MFS transporter n=1 Tax=Nocardia sp. alder85J TaxID=2862949 RepID=UPI001CD3F922|nr:YbfB/YjiJ family MFS transporter [Nocardia sp. alder85J]MCX4097978.1 YbfB/YjiJ family MFS transporter [Nocardia sp. alder85J]
MTLIAGSVTLDERANAWGTVVRGGAALAAAMGVGRFVYTPILPLMTAQAGLAPAAGASLATANYLGYLLGALAAVVAPGPMRSRTVFRGSLVLLILTVAAMPATRSIAAWWTLRLLAGVASAVVFVIAAGVLLDQLRDRRAHLAGWGIGGVGVGITGSGLLVLLIRQIGDWRSAWWAAAVLTALFAVAGWSLRLDRATAATDSTPTAPSHRWFAALFTSYTLEGIGYIIAGTFLVAAIDQGAHGALGTVAWVLVGISAAPSAAVWAWLQHRWSRPTLLLTALVLQAVGIALPAMIGGIATAALAAILFGATFLGVATLALAVGAHLNFPRSVALLTTGYSVGQLLGPLVVTPLLRHGYHQALLLAALTVLASAGAAALLRIGYPHHLAAEQPREV